jgi:hypothetical protein
MERAAVFDSRVPAFGALFAVVDDFRRTAKFTGLLVGSILQPRKTPSGAQI